MWIQLLKKIHAFGTYRRICLWVVNRCLCGSKKNKSRVKRILLNTIGFEIGENTTIVGPIECTGTLKIGKNCWIGKNFRVNGNGSVTIGDNCDIAPEVTFQTGGHKIGTPDRRAGEGLIFHQTVGDGTWIGGRSTILNNTRIGKSCVIAGCACVTRDVEDNMLVGGVPAKIIRRLDDADSRHA